VIPILCPSRICPTWLWTDPNIKPGYERVWAELLSHLDYDERDGLPPLAHLSRATGLSVATVKKALEALQAAEALALEERPGKNPEYYLFGESAQRAADREEFARLANLQCEGGAV
jgi:DNA-binding transcriptional MocR family regulator